MPDLDFTKLQWQKAVAKSVSKAKQLATRISLATTKQDRYGKRRIVITIPPHVYSGIPSWKPCGGAGSDCYADVYHAEIEGSHYLRLVHVEDGTVKVNRTVKGNILLLRVPAQDEWLPPFMVEKVPVAEDTLHVTEQEEIIFRVPDTFFTARNDSDDEPAPQPKPAPKAPAQSAAQQTSTQRPPEPAAEDPSKLARFLVLDPELNGNIFAVTTINDERGSVMIPPAALDMFKIIMEAQISGKAITPKGLVEQTGKSVDAVKVLIDLTSKALKAVDMAIKVHNTCIYLTQEAG